jgi:membrane protein implicated in regulation of membrane protease activity
MNELLLPSFARVRVSKQARGPALWVPLILLWPLWWLALSLVFLLLIVAASTSEKPAYGAVFRATRELNRVACGLRGLRCEVGSPRGYVSVQLV